MCLIRYTDDVVTVGKKSCFLAELLNRCDVDTAARFIAESLLEVVAALNTPDVLLMKVSFGCYEQLRSLRVKILSVLQKNNRRIMEHDQARQKQHRIGLAASSRTEVGAAFAIAIRTHVQLDIGEHFFRGEELRVPADNDFVLGAVVWVENEIAEDLQYAVFGKSALDHC